MYYAQIILKTDVGVQSDKRNDGTQRVWNATCSESNPVFLKANVDGGLDQNKLSTSRM